MSKAVDPKAIDTMIVEMSFELGRLRRQARAMAKVEQTDTPAYERTQARATALDDAVGALADLQEAYGWTRYFVVLDGHIHAGRGCSSLLMSTVLQFLPAESGNTVSEMIAKYTTSMCTICYPDAPVDPAYQEAVRKTEAEKQAARDERAAQAKAKADATPKGDDGKPLKVGGDAPKTLLGARNAMTRRFKDIYWYLETHKNNGTQPSAHSVARDMEVMAECSAISRSIARMTGEVAGDVYEASRIKAEKLAKAEFAKALRDQRR